MKVLVLSLLSISLFACGGTTTAPPPPKDSPTAPTSSTNTPNPTPTTNQIQSWQEEYKKIPASTALLIRFAPTEQMIASAKKLSSSFLEPAVLATIDMGPVFLRIFGVDPSKSIIATVDSAMPLKSKPGGDMPIFRFDVPLTNTETFFKSLQEYITKKAPGFSLAESSAGGYSIRYAYEGAPTTEAQTSLRAVIFAKETTASIFMLEGSLELTRGALEEQLLQYISRPIDTSLADDALFQSLLPKADPMGSFYFFVNTANVVKTLSTEKQEGATRLSEIWPGIASSITFSEKGLAGGYAAKINPPTLTSSRSIFPIKESPSYGTLFPSGTSVFYRSSLDLLGLKDALVELAPSTNPELFWKIITNFKDATGLGIETDVLLPLTGHVALGLDLSMVTAEIDKGPLPPLAFAVFQVTKESAGDELLKKLSDAVEQKFPERKILREMVDGEPIHTSQSTSGSTIAAMRCQDLLLFGLGKEAVQEMCARAKAPGKYFTETSSSALAKQLVNAKTGNGFFVDQGSIAKTFVSAFPPPPEKKAELEPLLKLSSLFGPFVSRSDYDAASTLYFGTIEMALLQP
jgi:hypothetical protein